MLTWGITVIHTPGARPEAVKPEVGPTSGRGFGREGPRCVTTSGHPSLPYHKLMESFQVRSGASGSRERRWRGIRGKIKSGRKKGFSGALAALIHKHKHLHMYERGRDPITPPLRWGGGSHLSSRRGQSWNSQAVCGCRRRRRRHRHRRLRRLCRHALAPLPLAAPLSTRRAAVPPSPPRRGPRRPAAAPTPHPPALVRERARARPFARARAGARLHGLAREPRFGACTGYRGVVCIKNTGSAHMADHTHGNLLRIRFKNLHNTRDAGYVVVA